MYYFPKRTQNVRFASVCWNDWHCNQFHRLQIADVRTVHATGASEYRIDTTLSLSVLDEPAFTTNCPKKQAEHLRKSYRATLRQYMLTDQNSSRNNDHTDIWAYNRSQRYEHNLLESLCSALQRDSRFRYTSIPWSCLNRREKNHFWDEPSAVAPLAKFWACWRSNTLPPTPISCTFDFNNSNESWSCQ